jgi:hypothetical protein
MDLVCRHGIDAVVHLIGERGGVAVGERHRGRATGVRVTASGLNGTALNGGPDVRIRVPE